MKRDIALARRSLLASIHHLQTVAAQAHMPADLRARVLQSIARLEAEVTELYRNQAAA